MALLSDSMGNQREQATGLFARFALPARARRATRILSYAIAAVLVGVVILVGVGTVPTLFGYHTYVVTSGSMEPVLKTGSVAVAAPANPLTLKVGDIIAYLPSAGSTHVLHRIVRIDEANGQRQFITQGDHNAAPDPTPVTLSNDGDRIVYSVPYAGYIVAFAQGWDGRFLLMGVPALLLAFILGRDARRPSPDSRARAGIEPERAYVPASPLVSETAPQAYVARAARPPVPAPPIAVAPPPPTSPQPVTRARPPLRLVPVGPAAIARLQHDARPLVTPLTFAANRQPPFTSELPVFRRVQAVPPTRRAA